MISMQRLQDYKAVRAIDNIYDSTEINFVEWILDWNEYQW